MTRSLHDGREDGLEPLESLDIRGADGMADLLERMSRTAFGGRELGEAFRRVPRHGRRSGLHPRGHRLRRHDRGQDGPGALRNDRRRPGADHRLHRGGHGPRAVRGHRLHPLQARSRGSPTSSFTSGATTASTTRWKWRPTSGTPRNWSARCWTASTGRSRPAPGGSIGKWAASWWRRGRCPASWAAPSAATCPSTCPP